MAQNFEADDYEDRLRALAAEGKTCTGAARAVGVHYKATRRMADELGIKFRRGGKGSARTPRTGFERLLQKMIRRELAMDPMARWA